MQHQAPRFMTALALAASSLTAIAQTALPPIEESASGVTKLGYKTVAAALEGLKAMPGASVTVTQPDGWTIAVEPGTKAMWSFTPAGHYANPAVVRREIKQRDGGIYVEMVALCQAEKEPCDRLIREFQELNQRMSEAIRNRQPGPSQK
jgi:hypothetical protein